MPPQRETKVTAPKQDKAADPEAVIAALRAKLDAALADKAELEDALAARSTELATRNTEYDKRIEYQSATSDVLKAMSRSPGDPQPVFDLIARRARDLWVAYGVTVYEFDGKLVYYRVATGVSDDPQVRETFAALYPMPPTPDLFPHRAILERKVIRIDDLKSEPGLNPIYQTFAVGSAVAVPLVRGDAAIGALGMGSRERGGFTDSQIELLKTFADQAVLAIENARLLRELRQRTDDLSEALVYQTGSSNILKVIASSPTDVGPALKAIVESACEICNAYDAVVWLKEADDLVFSAHHGSIPIQIDRWPINRNWITGRTLVDKTPQHIHDLDGPEGDGFPEGRELARPQGHRTVLSVPLLREDEAIGVISLRRIEVHPFNNKQIELLKSFADQAVIAISNVRLFEQVQQRTRELSKSLDDLRTAQDRLIQTEKLASLGQLTAGIAHEIKNPLNFVNNFSALSVELADELNDVLRQAGLVETIRKETDELTGMLKDNLSRIVQHGKRADSIVKNMLLHSREGSREQRPADVNALVEESLNLAYHGARAEKSGFEITLQRDLDANAGIVVVFPQEVSRALLNLISNGFYAATKRKTESDGAGFEPTVAAITKDLGSSVEIRIRDNGTGIPPEVREKMFNPFFTTKPTGEGTGLGLSMTHDIVVKQHGGRIDVETRLGEFTEFIITLPRNNRTGVG